MFNINQENTDFVAGQVIAVNKPLNWTSFNVVNKFRHLITKSYKLKKIKVGHAGTLDPLATGLLILCTGKATKRIIEFQDQEKEYIATFKFGETTPSFDLETEVDETYSFDHITKNLVLETINNFLGEIEQVPPSFSAKRVNGERAYEKARKGEMVELQPSKIFIKSIEILDFELPLLTLKIKCAKGTYIRALARDFGKHMNSGAHLTKLIRTKIGSISIDDAISVDDFKEYIKNI